MACVHRYDRFSNCKFSGVCRYVGPIRETYATPEIFVGVELDERLTQNNGQFGSQTYFNCAMGYGLMVPLEKVLNSNIVKINVSSLLISIG